MTVLYSVREYVSFVGRVVDAEMVANGAVGIGWTVLFHPVDVLS